MAQSIKINLERLKYLLDLFKMDELCLKSIIEPKLKKSIDLSQPINKGTLAEIDKIFNPDGIIQISTKDDIKQVLKDCTKENYESRLPAILDNYNRALEYKKNHFDTIYEKYLKR